MNDQKLKSLLNKYLSGNASKAESFIVESWLESFQLDKDDAAPFATEENQHILADQIIAKAINNNLAITEVEPKKTFALWKKVAGVAAVLAIISSLGIYYFKDDFSKKPTALATNYVRYNTKIKEFKQLQLPDSTIVYLNANSTLEVQQDFTKQSERRVKLTGEAFFDVKKDQKHPFKIQVGELQVKVLGTSFNINANEAANGIKVSVKSGKVNVSKKDTVLASLAVDQELVFNKITKAFEVQKDNANAKALWRDGIVILDKATFNEVSATIYNIYGVQLKSNNKNVLSERYNFTIRSSRTSQQTINQLCEMINKKHRKEGSAIVIF